MTQQTLSQPMLTPGTLDLAQKLAERGRVLVGPNAVKVSNEVAALVQLGACRIRRSYVVLREGGREALERAEKTNVK